MKLGIPLTFLLALLLTACSTLEVGLETTPVSNISGLKQSSPTIEPTRLTSPTAASNPTSSPTHTLAPTRTSPPTPSPLPPTSTPRIPTATPKTRATLKPAPGQTPTSVSSSTEPKCDWYSQPDLPVPAFFFKSKEGTLYFADDTLGRHVIDKETFMNLGYPESDIIDYTRLSYPYGVLSEVSEGAPFTRLLKGSGEEVYWMENGFRRYIPDMDTFRQLGYRTEDIFQVPDSVLRGWPLGEPLPSILGTPPESIPAPSQERVVSSYRPLDRHVRARELYTVYADGRNPRRLSYTTGYTWHSVGAWSPDGRSIAFVECLAHMPKSTDCEVATTSPDRWEPHWLTKALLMRDPTWSPDGTRLVLGLGSLGTNIAVMNMDGGNTQILPIEAWRSGWTPDGRIAFWSVDREDQNKTRLMIMNADGQNVQPVEEQVTIFDQRYFPWRQCKWVANEPPQQ